MSSEWRTYQLHDVGRIVTGKTPKSGVSDYEGCDVPFISPPDFSGVKWIDQTARCISEAGAQSVKGSVIPPRSVLVTCIGSDMGKAALSTRRCVTNQQINAVLVDETKFCPEFVYYNLSLRKNEIQGLAGGSAQPILNKSAFGQIEFDAPSLEEQKHISTTLRPIDDRITLLRETNATLEAIAQALFKSWFVDFDPVRAKLEGRTPEGMDEATSALFPDGFETTELGEVPRGWRVGELGDVATLKGGKLLSKEAFSNRAPNPVFGGAGVMGHTEHRNATDFVITVGRVGAYCGQFFWHIGDAWVNNNASHVIPSRAVSSEWLLLWLKSVNMDVIKKGAAQPFVSNGDIAKLPMIRPPIELIHAFGAVVAPIFARSQVLVQQSIELKSVRDALLPRLISGQLRLPEA